MWATIGLITLLCCSAFIGVMGLGWIMGKLTGQPYDPAPPGWDIPPDE